MKPLAPKAVPQRREFTGDAGADRIQQAREDALAVLRACPFIRGRLISVQLVGGVAKTINHRLGAQATFMLARPNYDGTGNVSIVTESATGSQQPLDLKNQLSIVASVSGKFDLWFYPIASRPIDARSGVSA